MSAGALTADGRARMLADGSEIPLLGLGVWQVPNGPECENAVRWALELGYRHIDTAQAYGNEESVGRALRDSSVPRDEVFITTKFYPAQKDPEAEAQRSLERLGVDRLDLYIIHWPQGGPTWAWPGMERARARGYASSIGVSNFNVAELDELLAIAEHPAGGQPGPIQPVQVPAEAAERMRRARSRARGLQPARHRPAPLGRARRAIAERGGRTPAQVLLRWCVQRELIVIPKSTHRERIAENAQIYDFALSDDDMTALDALDETSGTDRALESPWW